MNWFRNIGIAKKLAIGFATAIIGTGAIFWVGQSTANELYSQANNLTEKALPRMEAIGEAYGSSVGVRLYAIRATEADFASQKSHIDSLRKEVAQVDAALEAYSKHTVAAEDKQNAADLKKLWAEQEAYLNQIVKFNEANQKGQAEALLDGESRSHFNDTWRAELYSVIEWNKNRAKTLDTRLENATNQARTTSLIVLGVIIAVSVFLATFITRSITGPAAALQARLTSLSQNCLTSMTQAIVALKNGDLTVRAEPVTKPIENPSNDELGKLSKTFNEMLSLAQTSIISFQEAQSGLTSMLKEVQSNANEVSETSQNLSASSEETAAAADSIALNVQNFTGSAQENSRTVNEIAKGSDQLAASATDAAQSMDSLEGSIDRVKDGSIDQAEATKRAAEVAKTAGEAVTATINSMGRIQTQVGHSAKAVADLDEKQQQIGAIVQTINEIADQTNLLALNAAIEAARAGEHGRGFAVVADEVRKLAERSGEATKEIEGLINSVRAGVEEAIKAMNESSAEVESGSKSSDQAKLALQEILQAVAEVERIASANTRQVEDMSVNAKTVASSIGSVAAVAEETAAGAQQMGASNESILQSSLQISEMVQQQTAGIQEVSAVAVSLSQTALRLQTLIDQFKTDENSQTSTATLKIAA